MNDGNPRFKLASALNKTKHSVRINLSWSSDQRILKSEGYIIQGLCLSANLNKRRISKQIILLGIFFIATKVIVISFYTLKKLFT